MIVDGKDFVWMIGVAKKVGGVILLRGEDMLEFSQATPANDILISVSIPAEGKLVAPIYPDKLYNGIAKASGEVSLTVDKNMLCVEWEGGKYSTKLATQAKHKKVPEITYPAEYTVDTKELANTINSISNFFKNATFVADEECLKIKAEGDNLKVEASIGTPVRVENVAATFRLVGIYDNLGLKDVLRMFSGIPEVRISVGMDYPMRIEGEKDGREIIAMVAPVIEW